MHSKKIVLVGDSITECFNTKKHLPDFDIVNRGISANSSRDVINRMEKVMSEENPDFVFILIGTNDIAFGFSDKETLDNITSIFEIATRKLKSKNIYLTSILPTRNNDLRPNKQIDEMNRKIKTFTTEAKSNYLDLHSIFADETNQLGAGFTDDGLHLNENAYKKWADFLGKLLQEILG